MGVRRAAAALLAAGLLVAALWVPLPLADTRIHTSVLIRRPSAEVFDYVTTPANWPRWHPSSLAVSGATDHPLRVGVRWKRSRARPCAGSSRRSTRGRVRYSQASSRRLMAADSNPFAALSLIVAPAILTNACSVGVLTEQAAGLRFRASQER